MNNKWKNGLLGILLCICCMFIFKSITVKATISDLAEDYELGTECTGYVKGTYGGDSEEYGARYFKFSINEKSHVTLYCWYKDMGYGGTIYNSQGKTVLKVQDLKFKTNQATGWSNANQSKDLSAGIYYLKIDDNGDWGIQSFDFKFIIQAEKQIKLSKGTIASLKSKKKGEMTVKCKSTTNAIGYRIQYSQDYKFKKGVKTAYSPTTTYTIKKLAKGKRYYVKVSPYTVYNDGTYVFGQNSCVKQVLVKK